MTGYQLRTLLVFVGGVVVVRVIYDSLSSPSKEYAEVAVQVLALALLWFAMGSIMLRRRTAGAVLLELQDPSPSLQVLLLILAAGLLAVGVYLIYLVLPITEPHEVYLDRLLTIALCLSLTVVLIMTALPTRARIRRRRRRRPARSRAIGAQPDHLDEHRVNH